MIAWKKRDCPTPGTAKSGSGKRINRENKNGPSTLAKKSMGLTTCCVALSAASLGRSMCDTVAAFVGSKSFGRSISLRLNF